MNITIHPVSSTSHLRRLHPYPYTPGFEAVRSALWSVQEPKGVVEPHRARVLDIMAATQARLLLVLQGHDPEAAFADLVTTEMRALAALHNADARARLDGLNGAMVEEERAKWERNGSERLQDSPTLGAGVCTIDEGDQFRDQLEEAVRRLRPKNRYELLVFRFAAAVVLATAPYYITIAKWAPYLRQRGIEAFPELVPDPPAVTRTIIFQEKGLATIMAWFKGEIVLHLDTATMEYRSYAAHKAAEEERRRGGGGPLGL